LAALAVLLLAPRAVTANAILDTDLAVDETISNVIQLSPSDIVTDSATPLFGTTGGAITPQSDDEDFLAPEFMAQQPGLFPAHLYGSHGILSETREPSSTQWLTCGLLTIAWIGQRKSQIFKR